MIPTMAKNDYLDHLSAVPLFSACSKKELQQIAKATDEITIPAGKEFAVQDQSAREAFIIMDGTATVKRNNRKVASVGAGTVVGELGLLDRGPRTASVIADTPITALVIGPREFSALLDDVPSLNHKMLKALAAMVRELDKKTFG